MCFREELLDNPVPIKWILSPHFRKRVRTYRNDAKQKIGKPLYEHSGKFWVFLFYFTTQKLSYWDLLISFSASN